MTIFILKTEKIATEGHDFYVELSESNSMLDWSMAKLDKNRVKSQAIEKNIDNDQFSVDDLGNEIAMSRSQVHRKLKALTDQSATAFIRNYRLHRAADLLIQESGNVTEIAYQVGFNSQTYFSSSFQELFGCTPSNYKSIRSGKDG